MKAIMNIQKLDTIQLLEDFINGNQAVAFAVLGNKGEKYTFIRKTLVKHRYIRQSKREKGVIRRFLIKVTGYSQQQITRLIKQYSDTGYIRWRCAKNNGFNRKYSEKDVRLLADMDKRHDTPSGAMIKKLCERAVDNYGEKEFESLSKISISHLYNLRSSSSYQNKRRHFSKTQARKIAIGKRKKPTPNGEPGYIRIDTVHQGDKDNKKGVYHINAVDEVTQFEVICSVEKINEEHLLPALIKMLEAFPFVLKGFHSDNGSEYINYSVAALLESLKINFTKSRSRHSNDNGLAESKNASIIRKQFGYEHIPQVWADRINEFNEKTLQVYINYHRPCFFPETKIDNKGKTRKTYPYANMKTPYEKLKSIPQAENFLKPGYSFENLDEIAEKMSDNACADLLQIERNKLFSQIFECGEQERKKV